jgi:hypothetical protein
VENAAYIGLSRQMTLRRELDIAANNIANADTTGFKVEQLLLGAEVGNRARNDAIRPGASFVLDNGVGRDFSQGTLEQTGRSLDFAIEGEGVFFRIQDGGALIGRQLDLFPIQYGHRSIRCRLSPATALTGHTRLMEASCSRTESSSHSSQVPSATTSFSR